RQKPRVARERRHIVLTGTAQQALSRLIRPLACPGVEPPPPDAIDRADEERRDDQRGERKTQAKHDDRYQHATCLLRHRLVLHWFRKETFRNPVSNTLW